MKKTAHRFLCIVLTLCILCTISAVAVSAETADATIAYGTAYTLPTEFNGVTDIVWNGTVDGLEFGTQTITGTGIGGDVSFTVRVAAPEVVYVNDFDKYSAGTGASTTYSSSDLVLYNDAGADGDSIVEDTENGGKYLKVGPSTGMSMWSCIQPQGITDGKVAIRFRFRGKDLKGEYRDIFNISLRDTSNKNIGIIYLRGGSDGNPGDNIDKTRYLYARYSNDGSSFSDGRYISSNFDNGDTGWVNLTFVIDQEAGTYSFYKENGVLFENVRFIGTSADSYIANSTKVSRISFTRRNMSGEGYVCIDDIMYLDFNDESLTYPESNAAVTQKTVNIMAGESYELPENIGGINIANWNSNTVDTSKIGRQIFTGKNVFDQEVTLTVNIGDRLPVYENDLDDYELGYVGDTNSNSVGAGLVIVDGREGYVEIVEDAENNGKMLKVGPESSDMQMENGFKSPTAISGDTIIKCSLRARDLVCEWQDVMKMHVYASNGSMIANLKFQGGSDGLDGTNAGYSRYLYLMYGTTYDTYTSSTLIKSNFNNGDSGWFNLEIHLNQTDENYDVFVDETQVFTDVPYLTSSPGSINKLSIHRRNLSGAGYFNVDNVKFYSDEIITVTGAMPLEPINTEVGLGTVAEDTSVSLAMSNGGSMDFPVTYTVDSSSPGYKSVIGSVAGFNTETVLVNAKVLSYKPDNFVFEATDGTALAEPENGSKLKSIDVTRYTASDANAVMLVAVYDDGVIDSVTPAPITGVALGATKTIPLNIALPADVTNLDIRTFIWDSLDLLKPIDLDSYWESSKKKSVIYLAGDSTTEDVSAQSGDNYYPRTGWGEKLSNYIDSDKFIIDNRAMSGRSTKSFINEGRLDDILEDIGAGDYLFINFGHNDQAVGDETRYTTVSEYKENLRTYINSARNKGANPVLVTSVPRLVYKVNGAYVYRYTGSDHEHEYYG